MTDAQLDIVIRILGAGAFSIDARSTEDEIAAATFVFDNGLLFCREAALSAAVAARDERRGVAAS